MKNKLRQKQNKERRAVMLQHRKAREREEKLRRKQENKRRLKIQNEKRQNKRGRINKSAPEKTSPKNRRFLPFLRAKLPAPLSPLYTLLVFPCLVNFALNLYFFLCNPTEEPRDFSALFFSYLLMLMLHTFLLALVKRSAVSASLLTAAVFVLGVGNQFKMILSGLNPLFLDDLFFASDAATLGKIIAHSDLAGIFLYMLPHVLLFLFLLTLFLLAALFFGYRLSPKRFRIPALAASAILLFLTFFPCGPVNRTLLNLFFDRSPAYDAIAYYNKEGVLSGITGQYLGARQLLPEDYDEKAAKALLENPPAASENDWGKPNIVMIFSESFFDLSRLSDVAFSDAVTPNLSKLRGEGISFDMLSATFGGLSCNPEYEILTGSNLSFYPLGYTPYTMLYRKNNPYAADYPSVISELKNNGYSTGILSTWGAELCNCSAVYDFMGVDRREYNVSGGIKGLYPSDAGVGQKIISTLAAKEKGEPLFLMTLTAQAHMPYYKDKYDSYDLSIQNSPLTDEENDLLLSYAQGIYDADRMLGEVYAYIQTLEEPTLLIFYGDHLPILTHGGESLYDKLSYFHTGDALTDAARKYMTEGLILANFELTDDIDALGQDLLMPYVFSHCDLSLSPYWLYLISTLDTLPCFNLFASLDQDGSLTAIEALPAETRETYWNRRNLNAYLFALDKKQ